MVSFDGDPRTETVEYKPVGVKDLLVAMKDSSELIVDLAYSALLHNSDELASEVLALESLGLYEHGEGIGAARHGETTADGRLPVNLSGGLKAKGHPVGATGGSQMVEMTRLLRGDHPNSDAVPDAEVGVTHNAGGTVASAVVHVMEVVQ